MNDRPVIVEPRSRRVVEIVESAARPGCSRQPAAAAPRSAWALERASAFLLQRGSHFRPTKISLCSPAGEHYDGDNEQEAANSGESVELSVVKRDLTVERHQTDTARNLAPVVLITVPARGTQLGVEPQTDFSVAKAEQRADLK